MDEDILNSILFLFLFLALAACLIITVTLAVAWSRTRAWQKAQVRAQSSSPSSSPFLPEHADDLSDSEVEDNRAAEREGLEDVGLTTRQKFWKECGRVWSNERIRVKGEREKRMKERAERRKLAREVVREFARQGWMVQRDRGEKMERRGSGGSRDDDVF